MTEAKWRTVAFALRRREEYVKEIVLLRKVAGRCHVPVSQDLAIRTDHMSKKVEKVYQMK